MAERRGMRLPDLGPNQNPEFMSYVSAQLWPRCFFPVCPFVLFCMDDNEEHQRIVS